MKYDKQGRELPDGTPVEVPLKFRNMGGSDDILTGMLQRLREEQEKEVAETGGEVLGEEGPVEMFDLPTRYELDQEADERSELFLREDAKIRARRRAAQGEDDENRPDESGSEGDRGGAGRNDRKSRKAGRKADGFANRKGRDSKDDSGSEKRASEGESGDVE